MTAASRSASARTRKTTAKPGPSAGTGASAGRHIAIMDTTLRDGEQTPNVSYTPAEKLQLARMLLVDCEVDRIEMASTRVSAGEMEAAKEITKWARKARRDPARRDARLHRRQEVRRLDLRRRRKGPEPAHEGLGAALRRTAGPHPRATSRQDLRDRPLRAPQAPDRERLPRRLVQRRPRGSFDYVFAMVETLRELRVARVYLADTLGVFSPEDVTRYVGSDDRDVAGMVDFEYHGHNDYGLATANCLAAIRAGARGVHTSVNGMGERAGNTSLAEVVAAIHDHSRTRGRRSTRTGSPQLASMVETFSGKELSANTPIVGRDVYTQTAGHPRGR